MLISLLSIAAFTLSSPSYADQSPANCQNLIETTCGAKVRDLDQYRSKLSLQVNDYFKTCLASPAGVKSPASWAMLLTKKGRAIFDRLENVHAESMGAYDNAFIAFQMDTADVREVLQQIFPAMKSVEEYLVNSDELKKFTNSVKLDLKAAVSARSDLSDNAKKILKIRIDETQVQLPTQYFAEKLTTPLLLLDAFKGYYDSCGLNGHEFNAFNNGEYRVVICPGVLVSAIVNAQNKQKMMVDPVVLASDRLASRLPPEVQAVSHCWNQMDLQNIYMILAHEIGHSIDGGVTDIRPDLDLGETFFGLWGCQQKKYPAVQSTKLNILENYQASVGRNREVTADFWAGQALQYRFNLDAQMVSRFDYRLDSTMHALQNNVGLFCTRAFDPGSELVVASEQAGHLYGTKRIQALLDESPGIYRALGCSVPKTSQDACHF